MRKALLLLSPLLLLGCQTWGPTWSEVSGARYYNRTDTHRLPAIITRIDDRSAFPSYPIRIEPGQHEIQVQGTLRGWVGTQEKIVLTLEPCKRYYVNAQYPSLVVPRFAPIVDYVEDLAGCRIVASAK
jgi:hypothetical protein